MADLDSLRPECVEYIHQQHADAERAFTDPGESEWPPAAIVAHVGRGGLLDEVRRLTLERDAAREDVALLERVAHSLWLYVSDRGTAVRDMTTEEKERYANAVEAASATYSEEDPPVTFRRWWREV
jgi:hypothetical protein